MQLEGAIHEVSTECIDAKTAVSVLENELEESDKQFNDKLDQLEMTSRGQSLTFIRIPESTAESFIE